MDIRRSRPKASAHARSCAAPVVGANIDRSFNKAAGGFRPVRYCQKSWLAKGSIGVRQGEVGEVAGQTPSTAMPPFLKSPILYRAILSSLVRIVAHRFYNEPESEKDEQCG